MVPAAMVFSVAVIVLVSNVVIELSATDRIRQSGFLIKVIRYHSVGLDVIFKVLIKCTDVVFG